MSIAKEDILEAFNRRFATKKFDTKKKVPADEFDLVLQSARLSPTSFGFEPWDLIVVQDPAIREEMRRAGTWGAHGTLPTASHFVILTAKTGPALAANGAHLTHILTDIKNTPAEGVRGMTAKYDEWLRDDFELTTPELLHQWAARQAYIALGNMMTVAAMREIDSCPIEGFNIGKIADVLVGHGLLDSKTDLPVVMVAFGYRDHEQPPKTRRPLDEIVQWV